MFFYLLFNKIFFVNTYQEKGEYMKEYSKWKDDEVIKLFRFIENGKNQNKCLSILFSEFASLTNRMPNSVRNYYYAELNCLQNDKARQKKLNIDLNLHQKVDQKEFLNEETKQLVMEILKQTSKGLSVRKACLNLADGDINKMVRFQNKFRTVVLKDKNLYESCLNELKNQGVNVKNKLPNNVISMPDRRNILTESDINSLFLGLVKLVKKQATMQVNTNLKQECERANEALRKTLVELSEKENELKMLRKQFKVLNMQNNKLVEEVKQLRGKNAELITKQNKLSALKKFTQRYENKINEIN